MEENNRGFILKQIQEQEKVLTKFKDTPNAPEYKAAMKAFTTLLSELRKDEELEIKKADSEFERETKRRAEEHRFEMEQKDYELREYETDERIRLQRDEHELKVKEQANRLRDQSILGFINWMFRSSTLLTAHRIEATGHLIPYDKLGLERKLSN